MDSQPTTHVYLELSEPRSPEDIARLLGRANAPVTDARAMTSLERGYALTESLAYGIWQDESGAAECRGQCPPQRRHRHWEQLSEDQRTRFIDNLARFLENCRTEELMLDLLMESDEEFETVALQRDDAVPADKEED